MPQHFKTLALYCRGTGQADTIDMAPLVVHAAHKGALQPFYSQVFTLDSRDERLANKASIMSSFWQVLNCMKRALVTLHKGSNH